MSASKQLSFIMCVRVNAGGSLNIHFDRKKRLLSIVFLYKNELALRIQGLLLRDAVIGGGAEGLRFSYLFTLAFRFSSMVT